MTFNRDEAIQRIADDVTEPRSAYQERYRQLLAEPWPDPHNLEPWRCVWQPCKGRRLDDETPLCHTHVMFAWQAGQRIIKAGIYSNSVIRSTPEQGRVYFIRFGDRIKIGWSGNLPRRLKSLPHDEVLGSVPGTVQDEQRWHIVFADHRSVGEWFHDSPELRTAIATVVEAAG